VTIHNGASSMPNRITNSLFT